MRHIQNALLIPYLPADHLEAGRMLVQDRCGHRPPPWGFFGGGIEVGETPLEAVLRETWEELGIHLHIPELRPLDSFQVTLRDMHFTLHPFAWAYTGDLSEVRLSEGTGMEWVTPDEMLTRVEAGGPDEAVCHAMQRLFTETNAAR